MIPLSKVPAKPNYSLVLYYAADRPVNKSSLLGKFVDGSEAFRDARFKLIPSIVQVLFHHILMWCFSSSFPVLGSYYNIEQQSGEQGYWMVKRAVGSKACLLGKAVTCHYLRQDNFLEVYTSTLFIYTNNSCHFLGSSDKMDWSYALSLKPGNFLVQVKMHKNSLVTIII